MAGNEKKVTGIDTMDKSLANVALAQLKESIKKKYGDDTNSDLLRQANRLVSDFETLIKAGENLVQVHEYIIATKLVIDQPTQDNVGRLHQLGMRAQGSPSPLWQALGVTLILLGTAMIVAGVIMTAGTAGAGLGVLLGGCGLFAAGFASLDRGLHKGLSKDLSEFSDAMKSILA